MSKTRMTKNEKRRLLLKKQARRKSISRKALVIAIVLSLLMSGMVMILVNALDGRGYEDISPEIFNGTNTYSVPTEGIPRGTWFKYTRDGKKYVYQTQYDLVSGDILTLQDNDTIDIYHDPTVGAYNLLDYADLKSSNPYTFELKQGTATYNNDGIVIGYTDNILKAGQRYYYTPDNTNYYSFTPTEDIGYEWIETREQGVYTQKTLGDLTVTIDPNAADADQQFTVQGNKYTRKVIYELADSLESNGVYLITAVYNNTEYMLRYGDAKVKSDGFDNYDITAGGIKPDCPTWENAYWDFSIFSPGWKDRGEYVYSHTNKTVIQNPGPVNSVPSVETRIATSPTEDNLKFYDYNRTISGSLSDQMTPTTHSYYYDGDDGSLANDIYVYSEFSTYRVNVPQGLLAWLATDGSGDFLMGYDGNGSSCEQDTTTTNNSHKGYYTTGKALGTIYTLNNNYAKKLLVHEACTMGVINHNYGNMWDYDNTTHRLQNKNASLGDTSIGFSSVLNFNPTDGFTIQYPRDLESYTLIYKMKDVYTHESIDQHRSITEERKGHTQVDSTELEDVRVTLSHSGTYAQSSREFDVTITLTDESGDPVPGKWSTDDLEFTNGVYSTTMKNGDSIPFTNIPKGYSLNVSVTLPDGIGDENALYYSATINGQAGTEKDVVIDDDKQIPIVITDTRKKAHISLTYTGDNISNPDQTFPVTLNLTKDDADETPVSGTFVGTDASGYTFDNGECVVSPMANNQSFDLYVPEGYKLTTTVTLPAENTEYYISSVDETAGTTATTVISADDNIPIKITSVKELVTITNQTEGNSEQDNYADLTKKFPLKLTLYNADGQTPMSGDFIGSDGTTVYHFGEDGVCSNTIELADDESISLYLPKNMVLKVEDAENPLQYTTSYTDPVTPDSENPLKTSISGNDINIVVTHTRNWLPPVTLFGSSNDNHYSFIIQMVLGITVAAGIIYLVFLKRKLRIQ